MDEKDIDRMTGVELINGLEKTYDIQDTVERERIHSLMSIRAKLVGFKTEFLALKKKLDAEQRKLDRQSAIEQFGDNTSNTVESYLKIMQNSPMYDNVRYNLITNNAEIHTENGIESWSDAFESQSKHFIEKNFGIYNNAKHADALLMLFKERSYNPIIDLVESETWDGVERCEHFLTEWANADDTPYTREVSRLIFAGGINRLYHPGCKFDDVPVLIGAKQGEGKSSLVRWLAINDCYFSDAITEMDGTRAIEQLDGAWICEIAELLALTKQKEQEAAKAYITRQSDKYRKPYGRNIEERPRRCIFIGTTNNRTFLKDKTGNRRYYPVEVHSDGYWLHDHEQKCRQYIIQCWAEAHQKMIEGKMPNYANSCLISDFRKAQDDATEDDWRVGVIEAYLEKKLPGDYVCIRQIVDEALSADPSRPKELTPKETQEISIIVNGLDDWERAGRVKTEHYGRQRCWVKRVKDGETINELPF